MNKSALILVLMCALACCVYSQSQKPSPTPLPSDETDVVKITTALIQVDLTVTDKKGHVITDIRPDEVEIFENGEKQKISNFSFVSHQRTKDTPTSKNEKPVVLPPSSLRPEQVRRTIALVVDDLTLSFESTYAVRRALRKFVDEQMQEGDLIAIIRTGAGIGALQQFTTDRRQLYAAIEKVRWNPGGVGSIGAFAPLDAGTESGREVRRVPGERTPRDVKDEVDDFRESLFSTGTLGAVNYVVRGMKDLPGRKSVMLLSDGFKLHLEDITGFSESGRIRQTLRRLVDMANRASVVIYTMDARGLVYSELSAADDTTGRSVAQVEDDLFDRRGELLDTQAGLQYLAHQTGGISVINNNDLSGGIRKILDDQSYYLLGYEPDDSTFDPKLRRFNKLEIRVKRPGTIVRYRSGFFGVSDERIVRPTQTPDQAMLLAMTSPFAVNDISLKLNTLFYNSAKTGNVIRSLLHIRAQDLTFTDEPDGAKKAVFDVAAVTFGDNGAAIDEVGKNFTILAKKTEYEHIMRSGFVYDFSFPIKRPGAYQLRVALRDHGSNKLGSANLFVEVPNIKKRRLVLSGVVLENVPYAEWERRSAGQAAGNSDPLGDTSHRRFKRGTVLNYSFTIYNPKSVAAAPKLSYQTRIFRDGKPLFESDIRPVASADSHEPNTIGFSEAMALGKTMVPGEYVLQIVVTDSLAKEKRSTASQFVQFEIIE